MSDEVRRAWTDVAAALRRSAAPLVAFEVLAKVVELALLGPLTAWVLAMFVATTGDPTVSNEQIAVFLLSTTGAFCLLAVGTLTLLTTFVQQAGLMAIASTTCDDARASVFGSLRMIVRRRRDLFVLALLTVALALAVLAPCAALAGAGYVIYLGEYDINYYLSEKPPELWRAVSLAAVAAVALLGGWATLYLRFLFALPACVLSRLKPVPAMRASWQITRGRVFTIAKVLLAWLLTMSVLGWVVGATVQVIERVAIGAAGDRISMLLPALAGLIVLNVFVFLALSFVSLTSNALLVVHLYRTAATSQAELAVIPPADPVPVNDRPYFLRRWRVAQIATGGFLVLSAAVTAVIVGRLDIADRTTITAHRGGSNVAPENTLAAIEAAIAQGADMAEIDVQETADGVVVVLHDSDLKRISGQGVNIWETPYEQVRSLDAGSWFAPEFAGERVPTLQQVIDAARGQIRLNIELKLNGHEDKLVERVVGIISDNDFHDHCVVSSLDRAAVVEAKQLDERLRVGHIVAAALGELAQDDVDFLSIEDKKATWRRIRALHRAGMQVHVWTVNDPKRMAALIDLRVDSIITDDAAAGRAVLDARENLSVSERLLLGVRAWLEQ